jgi:hypothetical protein
MPQTLACRTEGGKHHTPPSEIMLPLSFLRNAIEEDLKITVPRSTWSDWCSRMLDSGIATRDRAVDIPTAAGLWTIAGLYQYGMRAYKGLAYNALYPQCLDKVKEICNVK